MVIGKKQWVARVRKKKKDCISLSSGRKVIPSIPSQNPLHTLLSRTGSYDHPYTRETRNVNSWLFHLDSEKWVRKKGLGMSMGRQKNNRGHTFYLPFI